MIANIPPALVAMESCSSPHYWGRVFRNLGHQVILIPAQHVKPFVYGGKSDAHDALAICEAASRPGIHPVPIKTIEQQDIQLLHRLRQRHIQHSTSLANQIRSLSREYGVVFPLSVSKLLHNYLMHWKMAVTNYHLWLATLFEQFQQLRHTRKAPLNYCNRSPNYPPSIQLLRP